MASEVEVTLVTLPEQIATVICANKIEHFKGYLTFGGAQTSIINLDAFKHAFIGSAVLVTSRATLENEFACAAIGK